MLISHFVSILITLLQQYDNVSATTSAASPVVNTRNGTISGLYDRALQQDVFLGIPYALPPNGKRRLTKPAPAAAWSGTLRAHSYRDWCPGNPTGLPGFTQENNATMSEDCLHINIIRPSATQSDKKMPVLVWVHGGGLLEGSAADGRYNGSFLVDKSVQMGMPIMFASFNYRLGAFSILAGSALEKTGSVNLGLYDQRQALAWIQENIAQFGGDPSRVTVMGESAGAISIGAHLLAYNGRDDGLFRGAILQSGGPLPGDNANRNATEREEDFGRVLQATGCQGSEDPVACLRSVPMESLNSVGQRMLPNIVIDGGIVPGKNIVQLEKGKFLKVPVLTGTNRNEGTMFAQAYGRLPVNTDEDFKSFIGTAWGGGPIEDHMYREFNALYQREIDNPSPVGLGTVAADAGAESGTQYGKATLWMGDMMFTAGRRLTNKVWAKGGVPSYSYFFDTVPTNIDAKILGAAHFQEIPYMFDNTQGVGWDRDPFPTEPSLRKKHEELADIMSRMWISFVVKQSPNHHKVPEINFEWPAYTKQCAKNMVFSAVDGLSLQPDNWRNKELDLMYRLARKAEL
ncbi:hypothetical protein FOPG_18421 [Fusarium oxysporum f. sp. conglutinans race 2 54008]|uniref:Carboxylic ester hydrolase n=1 Tax=Fusarium oxysporum f. sp. conglutinans race 2 54008 TaxID=1089457 RepID=X0GZR0_FUSOX|nr:hypothetical protein FOPG_18421 [Fusarium oxysporum f. sp. conglutinans race 2 54008]KAG6989288.1 Lipase 1 [Fusarium oxysporum f. sp. conglutinans]